MRQRSILSEMGPQRSRPGARQHGPCRCSAQGNLVTIPQVPVEKVVAGHKKIVSAQPTEHPYHSAWGLLASGLRMELTMVATPGSHRPRPSSPLAEAQGPRPLEISLRRGVAAGVIRMLARLVVGALLVLMVTAGWGAPLPLPVLALLVVVEAVVMAAERMAPPA